MSSVLLRAESVCLEYMDHGRPIHAVQDVSLDVHAGEFLGILGPSGSGKSSLLYLLSGMRTPTRGRVLYKGEELATKNDSERAQIRLDEFGFVFQLPHLIGYLSALENVSAGCPDRDIAAEAARLLSELGMDGMQHRRPHELSGGQKQRVCVARALAGGRKIIFADEPTAALDHKTGLSVVDSLIRNRGEGAIVMVTHDPSMLEEADRIIRLEDGRIADSRE